MEFEWDRKKAIFNLRKHGVDFADAVTTFYDNFAITFPDEFSDEQRFITMGMDAQARLIVTVYAWHGERIRIISARKATRRERELYKG